MNPGEIWWGQIGNSLRFLINVANTLQDCHSAVLQVSRTIPWRRDFYEAIDIKRSSFSAERRLVRLQCEENADPGEFVLDQLCSDKVRAEYWPGLPYAEYLALMEDIELNDCYVWIAGIHSKSDLTQWVNFVSQYTRHSGNPEQRGVFILEYDGPGAETSDLPVIAYSVENYDCRVFCLEMSAALNNTELQSYQAELALCIGDNDPEFCAALLLAGQDLIRDPVKTTRRVSDTGANSEGCLFSEKTEQQINSAAWNAAVVLLFPILERYRMNVVSKHENELSTYLPITNSNGDAVEDPYDLEIGSLYYIVSTHGKSFEPSESETIKFCRKVRNLLAHNRFVPCEDVRKVMSL